MKKIYLLALISLTQYVQAAPALDISLYKTPDAEIESINARIENKTNLPVQFKSLSLQQLINNRWTLIIYDVACPCLAKCNTATTTIEPKKNLTLAFNFTQLGCGAITKAAAYRAIAQGDWDKKANVRVGFGVSKAFIAKE